MCEEGRKCVRKEGRKCVRKEARKEGRKEGRTVNSELNLKSDSFEQFGSIRLIKIIHIKM